MTSRPSHPRPGCRPFTLLEVMIAALIVAVLAAWS